MQALSALAQLAAAGNSQATTTIYVVGRLIGLTDAQIQGFIGAGAVSFTPNEATAAHDLVTNIDQKIKAVVATKGTRMTYVDPLAANSPFNGHDLCSSAPYFNGLDLLHTEFSYHPNALGQDAYRRLVESALA